MLINKLINRILSHNPEITIMYDINEIWLDYLGGSTAASEYERLVRGSHSDGLYFALKIDSEQKQYRIIITEIKSTKEE